VLVGVATPLAGVRLKLDVVDDGGDNMFVSAAPSGPSSADMDMDITSSFACSSVGIVSLSRILFGTCDMM
jgi:hypothetical protein